MALAWNPSKHRSSHAFDEGDRAGNQASSLAFIDDSVSGSLIGCMMPGDKDLVVRLGS